MSILKNNNLLKLQKGATILELSISIIIVAILSSLTISSVSAVMNTNSINLTRQTLLQDIRLVRSTARNYRAAAYMCPTDHLGECSRSKNWNNGWIGFVDRNYNKQFDEADKLIVQYRPTDPLNVDILAHLSLNQRKIKIDSRGIIRASGHFKICDHQHSSDGVMKVIRMNSQGRLSIDDATNFECE